jgi:hypothetical protein
VKESRCRFGVLTAGLLVACGSSSSSIFENTSDPSSHTTPTPTLDDSGASGGAGAGGSGVGGGGVANSGGGGGEVESFDGSTACVTSTAKAQLTPVNLVFMYDRSGSMGDTSEGFDPAIKWNPAGAGLKTFFSDPDSRGLDASLQFFPLGATVEEACGAQYATPQVPLTPLTDSAPLAGAIDGTTPHGGTPTLPALAGAIAYASGVANAQPTTKTVVVLVTDGEPGYRINGQNVTGCVNNDIAHVTALAKSAFEGTPPIPTYVIGVGPSLDHLNAIAAAGGTNQAIMVSVDDPNQTNVRFEGALNAVRAATLSCDFPLPQPPDGSTLDVNAVNVVFSPASGENQLIGYNVDCAGGTGWRYDNPSAPARMMLCPTTCRMAQADRSAALRIEFGCQTVVVIR